MEIQICLRELKHGQTDRRIHKHFSTALESVENAAISLIVISNLKTLSLYSVVYISSREIVNFALIDFVSKCYLRSSRKLVIAELHMNMHGS